MRKGEGGRTLYVVYCAVFGLYVSYRCVVAAGGHQTFANFCDLFYILDLGTITTRDEQLT